MKWETTVRTRGRVLLPKELRDRKGWSAGTSFKVEECEDGVLLKYVDGSSNQRKPTTSTRKRSTPKRS